ncbi:MAG: DegT/DnrJ/EryC1/StrS family aminotransferase [Eubacterium sp.]|nr:DegT/DnrJ/EryC1/StrS family aminotransferase [Eubacterium sp.]
MDIKANRLDRAYELSKNEYEKAALDVLASGSYILGKKVEAFEFRFSKTIGRRFCIGVGSGYDALYISFVCLDIKAGDEVIVQGNTYIAVFNALKALGAVPVIAEPDENYMLTASEIEKRITDKTKAVVVTHLYGMMTPMDEISALCKEKGLYLVEDCAQAHCAEYKGKKAGSFGDVGCFSFYPTKNLGAFGDGGAIVTNNMGISVNAKYFRNQGTVRGSSDDCCEPGGVTSRLDELQAALLIVKLKALKTINGEKNRIAERYNALITNGKIRKPVASEDTYNVYHQYVITCDERDKLKDYLKEKGIETMIHYPVPAHLTEAFEYLGKEEGSYPVTERLCDTVLSLPCYYGLTDAEQQYIIDVINAF